MRVLIAGGTGFLGANLCAAVLRRTDEIACISKSLPDLSLRIPGVHYIEEDLTVRVPAVPFSPDLVLNAAGYVAHPEGEADSNRLLVDHVSVARNLMSVPGSTHARFLQIGSGDEYSVQKRCLDENTEARGWGSYGRAKAAASDFVMSSADEHGYRPTLLRAFLVYGRGQAPNRFLPQLIGGLAEGRRVPMSSGLQIRDFLHVDDFVEAVLLCSQTSATEGRTLNICSGSGVQIAEVARKVHRLIGIGELGFGEIVRRSDQAHQLVGDNQLIRRLTGWQPRISLESGLLRMIKETASDSQ